jgi:hypothetical protein
MFFTSEVSARRLSPPVNIADWAYDQMSADSKYVAKAYGINLRPQTKNRSSSSNTILPIQRLYPLNGMSGPEAIATYIWQKRERHDLKSPIDTSEVSQPLLINFENRAQTIWASLLEQSKQDTQGARIAYVEQSLFPSTKVGADLLLLKRDLIDFLITTDLDEDDDVGKVTHPLLKQIAIEAQLLFYFGFGERDKPEPVLILNSEIRGISNESARVAVERCSKFKSNESCKAWQDPTILRRLRISSNAVRLGALSYKTAATSCNDFGLFPSLNAFGLDIQTQMFSIFCLENPSQNRVSGVSQINQEQKLALHLLYWRMILPATK